MQMNHASVGCKRRLPSFASVPNLSMDLAGDGVNPRVVDAFQCTIAISIAKC